MAKVPLAFEPGTDWLYGYGHEIVAAMVDLTCGTSIGEFLNKEIFEPLGMKSTAYRYHDDLRERMITYYAKKDGKFTPMKGMMDQYHEPDAKYEMGGAGLFSTVPDYIKFSQMLANGGVWKGEQIIGRKTIDLMRANQLNEKQIHSFNDGNHYLAGYGYGLGVRTLMDQGIACFGATPGSRPSEDAARPGCTANRRWWRAAMWWRRRAAAAPRSWR
jgi:CubicO group peptidase (beta-lactamase class C family)